MKVNEKKMIAAVMGAYTRSCCRSTKNAFFKALFCRQKRITEKGRPTPKPNSLTKASKVFMCHFKDCNYEWLKTSTEPKLFCWLCLLFFVINIIFFFFTHNTTQHPKYNKTKQQTHTQHLKVQSKGRERGKDNKNTKVTPLYNHVYQTKNTAKHQWSKAWPH